MNKLDIELFDTPSNTYYFIKSKKQVHICSNEFKKIVLNYLNNKFEIGNNENDNYYFKKFKYLINNNYLQNKEPIRLKNRIEPNIIQHYIADSYRIVFELTENCNLNCKYCGYGEFYTTHGIRGKTSLSFETAKVIIDFFFNEWKSKKTLNHKEFNRLIQFYGGEPLLSFATIERIVKYTEQKGMKCKYTITTNAMLLAKYMDFLVKYKFSLLVSLDGLEQNNKYRVTKTGNNSFRIVFQNVKKLQNKYPDYFKKYVRFNTVLNDTSNIDDIYDFFKSNFGKIPELSEITVLGINKEKRKEFYKLFKSRAKCLEESKVKTNNILDKNPFYNDFVSFLYDFSPLFFYSYNQLLNPKYLENEIQTGSCRPFVNRIYVTTKGKILHCNFIEPKYILGEVIDGKLKINEKKVANIYNELLDGIENQCRKCYRVYSCRKCLFLEVKEYSSPQKLDNKLMW